MNENFKNALDKIKRFQKIIAQNDCQNGITLKENGIHGLIMATSKNYHDLDDHEKVTDGVKIYADMGDAEAIEDKQ